MAETAAFVTKAIPLAGGWGRITLPGLNIENLGKSSEEDCPPETMLPPSQAQSSPYKRQDVSKGETASHKLKASLGSMMTRAQEIIVVDRNHKARVSTALKSDCQYFLNAPEVKEIAIKRRILENASFKNYQDCPHAMRNVVQAQLL